MFKKTTPPVPSRTFGGGGWAATTPGCHVLLQGFEVAIRPADLSGHGSRHTGAQRRWIWGDLGRGHSFTKK